MTNRGHQNPVSFSFVPVMIPILIPAIRSLISPTKLEFSFDLNPYLFLIEEFPSTSRNCFLFLRKSACPDSVFRFLWIRHPGGCPSRDLSGGWWFLSLLDRILSHKPPWISLDILRRQPIRLCLYLLVVTLNSWVLEILDLLGSRVVDRWGCDLPFPFTALSVTNALSFMGIGEITPLYFMGTKKNSQTYWITSHGPMVLPMFGEDEEHVSVLSVSDRNTNKSSKRRLEEFFAFMEFTQADLVVRRCSLAYSQGIRCSWYRMEKKAKSKIVQMTMIQKFWYHNVNISELIWKHQVYHAVSKHGVSAKKWYPRIIRIRARFCISSHYMAHKYAYVIVWFSKVLYTDFVNLS